MFGLLRLFNISIGFEAFLSALPLAIFSFSFRSSFVFSPLGLSPLKFKNDFFYVQSAISAINFSIASKKGGNFFKSIDYLSSQAMSSAVNSGIPSTRLAGLLKPYGRSLLPASTLILCQIASALINTVLR